MPEWIVPLADVRLSDSELEVVAAVYRGGWLSQGAHVQQFERDFAEFTGSAHAIAVSSGTAALTLACALIGFAPGDEVVMPSLTFAATAAAVVHAGATPVFADVAGADAPWLSAERAAAACTARTRAIINVAYGGHPGETLALRELAHARGVTLVEDAAHACGARIFDRHLGTIGEIGAFSFFANKNLALGEGGMLVTDDAALADRARRLRSHGLTSDTWARHHGDAVDYDVSEPGFNFRLDEPRAALGVALLRRLTADNRHRAALAARYSDALAGIHHVRPVLTPALHVTCAWHLYPVLLGPQIDRSRLRMELREAGIQTSVHYPPLHLTRAFGSASARPQRLPVTEDYARRTLTLPLFAHMTETQQNLTIATLRNTVERLPTSRTVKM